MDEAEGSGSACCGGRRWLLASAKLGFPLALGRMGAARDQYPDGDVATR